MNREFNFNFEGDHNFTISFEGNNPPVQGEVKCSCGVSHAISEDGVFLKDDYQKTFSGEFFPSYYFDLLTSKVEQKGE